MRDVQRRPKAAAALTAMLGDDFGMAGPVVLCCDGEEKADRNRAKHP